MARDGRGGKGLRQGEEMCRPRRWDNIRRFWQGEGGSGLIRQRSNHGERLDTANVLVGH